jgi:O-antigen/teichoic acid export membrane protein
LFYNSASVHFLDVYTNGKSQLLIVEITIFTAVSMQNLVTQSIFYASGKYALWEFFYNTTFLIEGFAAAVVIIDGGGFESAVEAYVVTRIISASSLLVFSRKIAPWTVDGDLFPSFAEIKRLSIPAFAAILQPASNAITLQGAIIGIGSATNPEMVPYFSTIRTISRTTLQFAYRFSYASMPKFTIAYASNQKRQKASLIILNLVFSTCFIVPTFPLLYVFGQKIIYIWTRGHVIPSKRLLLIMLTSMALNSIWVPMANILSSINQHWRFTYFFFIVSISSIAIGTFFTRYYGINAMGYALVGEEFVMVIWTSFCLRYSDAFDGAEIWRIIRSGVLQKSFYLSK